MREYILRNCQTLNFEMMKCMYSSVCSKVIHANKHCSFVYVDENRLYKSAKFCNV